MIIATKLACQQTPLLECYEQLRREAIEKKVGLGVLILTTYKYTLSMLKTLCQWENNTEVWKKQTDIILVTQSTVG